MKVTTALSLLALASAALALPNPDYEDYGKDYKDVDGYKHDGYYHKDEDVLKVAVAVVLKEEEYRKHYGGDYYYGKGDYEKDAIFAIVKIKQKDDDWKKYEDEVRLSLLAITRHRVCTLH